MFRSINLFVTGGVLAAVAAAGGMEARVTLGQAAAPAGVALATPGGGGGVAGGGGPTMGVGGAAGGRADGGVGATTGAGVGARVDQQVRVNIAWQVALEGADFSPGIVDGAFGAKGKMALKEYAARYFPGAAMYDVKVYQALKVDVPTALAAYTITAEDAAQVGGPIPDDWNIKAGMTRLNYESLADCIAEKFHCTQGLLTKLNPGVTLAVGKQVVVPNVRPFPVDYVLKVERRTGAAWVTVNLGEKAIRVFDKDGGELALFNCSVAKDKNKLPDHDTKVQLIASPNPGYTFNPSMWPEVHNVTHALQIPPGPRNPVGLSWVQLDLPGYGIHGVPKPELIGKTGSHGCFRLTNWDALKFAGWVTVGMPVKIINPDVNPA